MLGVVLHNPPHPSFPGPAQLSSWQLTDLAPAGALSRAGALAPAGRGADGLQELRMAMTQLGLQQMCEEILEVGHLRGQVTKERAVGFNTVLVSDLLIWRVLERIWRLYLGR